MDLFEIYNRILHLKCLLEPSLWRTAETTECTHRITVNVLHKRKLFFRQYLHQVYFSGIYLINFSATDMKIPSEIAFLLISSAYMSTGKHCSSHLTPANHTENRDMITQFRGDSKFLKLWLLKESQSKSNWKIILCKFILHTIHRNRKGSSLSVVLSQGGFCNVWRPFSSSHREGGLLLAASRQNALQRTGLPPVNRIIQLKVSLELLLINPTLYFENCSWFIYSYVKT